MTLEGLLDFNLDFKERIDIVELVLAFDFGLYFGLLVCLAYSILDWYFVLDLSAVRVFSAPVLSLC